MTCPLDAVPGDPVDSDHSWWTVTERDAASMNVAVEMPDQPDYDWTGVLDESNEEAA